MPRGAGIPVAQPVASPQSSGDAAAMHVVLGIPFLDAKTAALFRSVLIVSFLMAALALASCVLQIVTDQVSVYFGIVAAIGIPFCGLMAAKTRSRECLMCFIAFSACQVLFFVIAAILDHGTWMGSASKGIAFAALGLAIGMAILQVAGVVLGCRLLNTPYMMTNALEDHMAPPPTVIVAAQPAYIIQQQPSVVVLSPSSSPPPPGQYYPQPQPQHYTYAQPQPQPQPQPYRQSPPPGVQQATAPQPSPLARTI